MYGVYIVSFKVVVRSGYSLLLPFVPIAMIAPPGIRIFLPYLSIAVAWLLHWSYFTYIL